MEVLAHLFCLDLIFSIKYTEWETNIRFEEEISDLDWILNNSFWAFVTAARQNGFWIKSASYIRYLVFSHVCDTHKLEIEMTNSDLHKSNLKNIEWQKPREIILKNILHLQWTQNKMIMSQVVRRSI